MVEHLSFQSLCVFRTAMHTVWWQKGIACSLALFNSKAGYTSPAKIICPWFSEGSGFILCFLEFFHYSRMTEKNYSSYSYLAAIYIFLLLWVLLMCFRTLCHCTRTLRISTTETSTCAFGTAGTVPSAACRGPRWTWWREFPMTITGHSRESKCLQGLSWNIGSLRASTGCEVEGTVSCELYYESLSFLAAWIYEFCSCEMHLVTKVMICV